MALIHVGLPISRAVSLQERIAHSSLFSLGRFNHVCAWCCLAFMRGGAMPMGPGAR